MQDYTSYPRHLVGPDSSGGFTLVEDSGTPRDYNGPTNLWFAVNLYGGSEKVDYMLPKNSTIDVFIREPFSKNNLTSQLYYTKAKVYLGFGCYMYINTPNDGVHVYYPTMFIDWGERNVSINSYREFGASVGIPFAGPAIRGLCETFCAWAEDHKPVQGDIYYYAVELSQVAIDTGVVTHNTALPSSRDWQPANVT